MTRLEASAWPLAGGSASVFAIAVVLDRLPWQAAFGVVTLAVAAWAWPSPPVAGAGVGGVAWLCVTGFDVHRFGVIEITGRDDAARAAVLVLAGVLVAAVHTLAEARGLRRRADPVWAEFHATTPGPTQVGVPAPRPGDGAGLEEAAPRTSDRGTE
ncbi:hypothetical protein [Actinoallomurus iriomotensis]|uniref:Uncharacterized protein n=1 Tax=Actinoallomurus iriomotensis TaxID=478107 RepID=A0A9W6SBN4_9ACTN|nr:hypothetical protein [Actinoallomurus iriomotensis]GLY90643.1 hypothetical protein Airi02_085720 [Actinoallomurus iriomotensis]